jgi:pilus assembly protein CpaE
MTLAAKLNVTGEACANLLSGPDEDASMPARKKNVTLLLRSESARVDLASAIKDVAGAIDFYLLLRPESVGGPFGRNATEPDAIIIDVDASDPADINYIRALRASAAVRHIPIVALTDGTKHLAALGAIRAGADDVIMTPINATELAETLSRVMGEAAKAADSAHLGRLISFVHVSGGSGATTLAVNSAAAIAQQATGVCLLDLDVQYGNAASLLDIRKVSPVDTLIDEPARLDADMFENMLITHETGVRVLTAPKHPFALGSYRSDMVANLIHLARHRFSVVVADLPVALAPWTDVVLRESAAIFVVCAPNVVSVHRLTQFLRLMERENLADLPFRIVLNRLHAKNEGGDISEERFAEAVGRPVDCMIDNDYGLISLSHNQGRAAVCLKPKSRFARQVTAMLAAELGNRLVKPAERTWWRSGA